MRWREETDFLWGLLFCFVVKLVLEKTVHLTEFPFCFCFATGDVSVTTVGLEKKLEARELNK